MSNSYENTAIKKYLDANGLAYFARKLNDYPNNSVLTAVVEGVQEALGEKVSKNATGNVAYGICESAENDNPKIIAIEEKADWKPGSGALLIITFRYAVPAGATMKIGEATEKSVYYIPIFSCSMVVLSVSVSKIRITVTPLGHVRIFSNVIFF